MLTLTGDVQYVATFLLVAKRWIQISGCVWAYNLLAEMDCSVVLPCTTSASPKAYRIKTKGISSILTGTRSFRRKNFIENKHHDINMHHMSTTTYPIGSHHSLTYTGLFLQLRAHINTVQSKGIHKNSNWTLKLWSQRYEKGRINIQLYL